MCKRPLTMAGFASAYHGAHAYLNSATYLLKIVCTVTSDQFNVTNSSTTIHKMNGREIILWA